MKLKAAITEGTPESVVKAMGSKEFAGAFIKTICADILGATNAIYQPGPYYVQKPDMTVQVLGGKSFGVELRLTGVSRRGRTAKQFHDALNALHDLATGMIREALEPVDKSMKVQLFTVLMLDGDVETSPGSGFYSNVLEAPARWIEAKGYGPESDLATTEA